MNYEEIYKRLTNEDKRAKYPEAIDGGFGWRPVSGYRFIKRDYPTTKWVGFWEDVFDCYDGWDSMDYRDQPTYVGKTKEEAVLGCYINELKAEAKDYEEKIDNLRRELQIIEEACTFWKDEAKTLSKRVSYVQGKLEELKDESDTLAWENKNFAEYLARELDHSQENIDTIAHGFWTYRKEEPTGELVHCLNCDNVFEEVKLDGGCRACGESVEGTVYLDPSSELYQQFKNNIKGDK